jgi:hypothetical protein
MAASQPEVGERSASNSSLVGTDIGSTPEFVPTLVGEAVNAESVPMIVPL